MGGVPRDSSGNVRGLFCGPLRNMSADTTEIWAMELFCTCPLNGKSFLIIKTDSKNAVCWICKTESRPCKKWQLFADIDHLIKCIGKVDFVHVFREANVFADALAKLGVNCSSLFSE
ncbi:hypothetical protein REPUB_Repub04eG0020000 [Reevesia pubescens]